MLGFVDEILRAHAGTWPCSHGRIDLAQIFNLLLVKIIFAKIGIVEQVVVVLTLLAGSMGRATPTRVI